MVTWLQTHLINANLLGHKLSVTLEVVVVLLHIHVHDFFRNTVGGQVGLQRSQIGNRAVNQRFAVALGLNIRELAAWKLVADLDVDGEAFGFDDGQRASMAVAKDIVGARAVPHAHLIANAIGVHGDPFLICQLGINQNT